MNITGLDLVTDEQSGLLIEGETVEHYLHEITGSTYNGESILYVRDATSIPSNLENYGLRIIVNSSGLDVANEIIDDAGLQLAYVENSHFENITVQTTYGASQLFLQHTDGINFTNLDVNWTQGRAIDEFLLMWQARNTRFDGVNFTTTVNTDQPFDIDESNNTYFTDITVAGEIEYFDVRSSYGLHVDTMIFFNSLVAANSEIFTLNDVFDRSIRNINVTNSGPSRSPILYLNGFIDNFTVENFYFANNNTGTGQVGVNAPYTIILDNDQVTNFFLINGTLESINYNEIYVNANVNPGTNMTLINVVMPDDGANLSPAPDARLERIWTATLQVTDPSISAPLALANVEVNNSDGGLEGTGITDTTGEFRINLTEYIQNETSFTYAGYNNYTFFAEKLNTNQTSANISAEQVVTLDLIGTDFAPDVTLLQPSNDTIYVSFNQSVVFEFSALDDVNLTSCKLYHNASGIFTANETINLFQLSFTGNFSEQFFAQAQILWNVECTDTNSNTSFASSNFTFSVENPNTPPTQSAPLLSAETTDALDSDDLICEAQNLQDVDGDSITEYVFWERAGSNLSYAHFPVVFAADNNTLNDTFSAFSGTNNGADYLTNDTEPYYSFEGGNDHINLGNLDFITEGTAGEYTVVVRVRFDQTTQQFIFGDGNQANEGVHLQISNGGVLQTYVAGGLRSSSFTVSSDEWYDIALRQDSSGITLFVNGTSQGLISAIPHQETSEVTYLGAYLATQRDLNGDIAELQIFSHGLSDESIGYLYTNRSRLGDGDTSPAESFTCFVLPFDGEDTGSLATSNSLIVAADYDFAVEEQIINASSLLEGQTYAVTAILNNTGKVNSSNVTVGISVEHFSGIWTVVNQSTIIIDEWEINSSRNVSVNVTLPVGITRVNFSVDENFSFVESLEFDNSLSVNYSVSAWSYFTGNLSNTRASLSTVVNNFYYNWLVEDQGYILYGDSEGSYLPFNLDVFNETDDFNQSDAALNLSFTADSIVSLYDADGNGVADQTITAEIAGRELVIPVTDSTPGSAFITGILYDASTGSYDGTQEIVIVTFVTGVQVGTYGPSQYEVRVPHTLGRQVGVTDQISSIYALD